jgi:hypothetical protein
MRRRMTLVAVLTAGLTVGVATASPAPRDPDPSPTGEVRLVASTDLEGKPILTNSLDGKPILAIAGLQPGKSRSGQVTLTNAGSAPQSVSLWQTGLTSGPAERPSLAAWAQLAVYDGALGKRLYLGAYQDFPTQLRPMLLCGIPTKKNTCPAWDKGETHVFTFTVTFPDVPTGSGVNVNTYQSTWLRSGFDWTSAI